jgi:hypothetical protein
VAPFRPKGLIDIILNIRFMGGSEGIDGFPGGHPNLNSSHLGLMDCGKSNERQSASYIYPISNSFNIWHIIQYNIKAC